MKITKRQLRKIIREEIQREGFIDWAKEKMSGLTKWSDGWWRKVEEFQGGKIKSDDAWELFKAMAGWGTDEAAIGRIMQSRADDLTNLYSEFNQAMSVMVSKDLLEYAVSFWGLNPRDAANWNSDLISWLKDDGMDAEADAVEAAITQARVSRAVPDPQLRGVLGLKTGHNV